MDKIDKFVYINLDKRIDRNEHISKELKNFGIPDEKIIRVSAVPSPKGAYGCALSHLKMMELFRDTAKSNEVWCFLEDDHYFPKSREVTDEIVSKFVENDTYDVLVGCYCDVKGKDLKGTCFRRIIKSSMMSCYIVKKRVCEALIASNKQSASTLSPLYGKRTGIPCDFMWWNLMKVFVFVAPYFPIGSQIKNHSDIRNKVMDYTNYIGIKIDRELEIKK
jgi:hypothetical protein